MDAMLQELDWLGVSVKKCAGTERILLHNLFPAWYALGLTARHLEAAVLDFILSQAQFSKPCKALNPNPEIFKS